MLQIHTFRAESLQAALQQVRQKLGPDASILHTREKRHSRLGLFARSVIEVEATLDPLRTSRVDSDTRGHGSAPLLEVQAELLLAGVSEQLASGLVSEVWRLCAPEQRENAGALRGLMGQLIAAKMKASGSIELPRESREGPLVVALVGPTGVGKTTTLAKIAAGFRFDLGCRVGLIALDTLRLGAVDQLLQHAELLSAELEVVSSAEQVTPALRRLHGCDLVLLDTAGRAPRDSKQLSELREFLGLARPASTHLVVSATSSIAYVQETLRQFNQLGCSHLLITKLDEAVGFGGWLPILQACPLPISYLTTGQHVPQDIVVASPRKLTSWLLGMPLVGNAN